MAGPRNTAKHSNGKWKQQQKKRIRKKTKKEKQCDEPYNC